MLQGNAVYSFHMLTLGLFPLPLVVFSSPDFFFFSILFSFDDFFFLKCLLLSGVRCYNLLILASLIL